MIEGRDNFQRLLAAARSRAATTTAVAHPCDAASLAGAVDAARLDMDVPGHPNVLIITDAAINIFPTLEDKVDIIQNAIDVAHAIGIAEPKVAILSVMEKVNPKLASTVEAGALCTMADRGQITGALLDGPLALGLRIGAAR